MGAQTGHLDRQICIGLLAHVDAGKTTLSEAMLYAAGALRQLGRVDHQTAFLDTHFLERARGITIFSKQARLTVGDTCMTLVDTPGHVDFSAETERTLQVLDYAVLVISGTNGVQAHTLTLWKLLRQYHVPTVVFVNKMDLPGCDVDALMENLRRHLSDNCVNVSDMAHCGEEIALCDDQVLETYLQTGQVPKQEITRLIRQERLFPCCFGSALRLTGVERLLELLQRYTEPGRYGDEFAARAYQITRDPQGNRMTVLKVTGGCLRVRTSLRYQAAGEEITEKVKEIRLYSGAKYESVEEAPAGTVCSVLGLSQTRPGQCFGAQAAGQAPVMEPVMTYRLNLPKDCDPAVMLPKLRQLEEEDPQLHIVWNPRLREIHVRLMGQVQTEIFKSLVQERFDTEVTVDCGRILYKETIAAPVEGVGHFEPLRHYAEVHLLLEPLPRGTGLVLSSACSEDVLDRNWQRLILTHLAEKTHLGVLTGAPITDIKITLMSGRAHLKHTEGGDFRQATYRAVRMGLMSAQSVLLEPFYRFRLTVPAQQVGRAIGDLRAMHAEFQQETAGEMAVLTGMAPVAAMQSYHAQMTAYTRGMGQLSCQPGGYAPCVNPEEVLAAADYDPERDVENPPDSVFCAHGAGFTVKWREVPMYMHLESCMARPAGAAPQVQRQNLNLDDRELEALMEREFGPIRRRQYQPPRQMNRQAETVQETAPAVNRKEYLIVDGYNVVFAWAELSAIAKEDLETARTRLMDILSNYAGFKNREVILIFDGYRVKGSRGARFLYHNLVVVYTRENETCDAYIEALVAGIGKHDRVWVATSDSLIQLSTFRSGLLRMSARELQAEVESAGQELHSLLRALDTAQKVRDQQERMQAIPEEILRLLPEFPEKSGGKGEKTS